MEKTILYIESLLIRNDYVIIPELGGFVVQAQSAQISSNGITPPLSYVGFNARMNNNDGLLATEILRSENISYREANKRIEAQVEQIKNELYRRNKVEIGKLGYLYLNKEQQISFTSSQEYYFLPSNFGFKTLHAQQREKNEEKKIIFALPSKNVFRYAAVILALFGIFFTSPKIGNSEISSFAGINNPLVLFESTTNTIVRNKVEAEEIVVQEITINHSKEYHIIVSCLPNIKSAEHYCELLKAKHYDNVRILPSSKTNRIAVESFSDKETATLYLKRLRKSNKEFKDAWLHREIVEN